MTKVATAQTFSAEERRLYIGASEVAAIMGRSNWATPLDIYNRKLGLEVQGPETADQRRGKLFEPLAAALYQEQEGVMLFTHDGWTHPEMPYFVGHPDRVIMGGSSQIYEAKCPRLKAFRKAQRDGLSDEYILQAQALMGLSGYPILTWHIFCAELAESAIFQVTFEPTIYAAIETAVKEFWTQHVEPQIPPFTDKRSDIELPKIGGDGSITKRDDAEFAEDINFYWEAKELEADAKELMDSAKERIKNRVDGTPGVYEGNGSRVYFREVAGRKTLDKAAMTADGIDVSKYEKTGQPFTEMRVYKTGE